MNKRYKLPQHLWIRNKVSVLIGLRGWAFAWREESSFRQWLVVAILLTPVAIWLGEGLEIALMVGFLWLIVVLELVNTAIETALDRITLDDDEAVRNAKDVASSAVFAMILVALGVWGFCLFAV